MTDLSAGESLVRFTGRADSPHTRLLRSFPFRTALRFVIDSASPAVQGGLLTADAGAHPACCTGIGLVLRPQPDPDVTQARCSIGDCPATPTFRLALTMTPLILCLHFIPYAPRCFRCAQGYRCCEPWAHSSLCRHSALPCLRFTARRHRQSTKSPQKSRFRRNFVESSSTNVEHRKAVGQSVPMKPKVPFGSSVTHWRFYRTSASIALHIPLNQKAVFVSVSAGRSGDPLGQSGAAAP